MEKDVPIWSSAYWNGLVPGGSEPMLPKMAPIELSSRLNSVP